MSSDSASQMRKAAMHQNRKASLTIADLESIHECSELSGDVPVSPAVKQKYMEHSEIFDELCDEVDQQVQQDQQQKPRRMQRRSSLSGATEQVYVPDAPQPLSDLKKRRHSSYESRCRNAHRQNILEVKELISELEDKSQLRRSSFVKNLLNLSVSVDLSHSISCEGEFGIQHQSIAMQNSCPVLSYVNDDEEDSVELAQLKRPSLISTVLLEDDEEYNSSRQASWETLKDDGSMAINEPHQVKEYIIELPPMSPEMPSKRRSKRTRRHSYQMLEKRLEEESPLHVLKSWTSSSNLGASMAGLDNDAPPPAPSAKSYVENVDFDAPKRSEPVVRRMSIGRAA